MSIEQRDEITVLHVDDEPDFADLAAEYLEREDDRISVLTATSVQDGLAILAEADVDCIISDYDMPDTNGIEFLESIRDNRPDLPFILYTGKGSEEVASEAISAGVTDYLQKETGADQYALLANRVVNAVERTRAGRQLDIAKERYRILEQEITALSIDLLQAEAGDIDEKIHAALETVGTLSGADRSYVFQIDEETETVSNTHEWVADGVEPQIDTLQNLPLDTFPWWMGQLENAENVTIPDVSALPAEAEELREILAEQGIQSLIAVPMITEDELVGFIGFDWVKRKDSWSKEFIDILFMVGKLITSALERETRRRELERREAFLEQSSDIISVMDADGTVSFQSASTERVTDFSPAEVMGESGFEHVHPEDQQKIGRLFPEFVAQPDEEITAELRVQTKDDSWRWIEVRGVNKLEDPLIDGLVFSSRDITERKERERQIQQLKERLELAVEGAELGVWGWDMTTNEVEFNEQWASMLGLSLDEIDPYYETWAERIHPEDAPAVDAALEAHITDETDHFDIEHRIRDADGDWLWVRVVGRVLERDDSGDPIRAAGIQLDITDQKERERELQEQNERLDEFASIVSHDLRSPLNVARGRIELARDECDSDHLADAAEGVDRGLEMIEDMLRLARAGEHVSEMEPVDVSNLVDTCWGTVETANATIVVDLDTTIRADRSRLRQLLENLFRNSIDHTDDDVTVTVGPLEDGFYVEDDGPGIPQSDRDAVFGAGTSMGTGGTGFGLSIVEQVVEAHDWQIEITTGSEGGARFEITGVEMIAE
jgi:PAS domain S-box-containing protein